MRARIAALAYAFALLCVVAPPAAPALADTDIRKHVEQNNAAYVEAFNRKDVAGVVAQYASGAVVVNPTGLKTEIPQLIEGVFKSGMDRLEATVDQAWAVGSDIALGMGRFRISGKDPSGAALEAAGYWTVTYVQEGGRWKIRMSSIIPQPPAK